MLHQHARLAPRKRKRCSTFLFCLPIIAFSGIVSSALKPACAFSAKKTGTGRNNPLPASEDESEGESDKVAVNGIRYRGRIAYDGTGYCGWQVQSKSRNVRTVQGELEAVLSRRFNRNIRVVGAGRTDAGVHARGQAFHFDVQEGEVETQEDELQLQKSLNRMLRQDTRVWNISRAPQAVIVKDRDGNIVTHKWHVIINATKKLYSYRICTAPTLDPIQRFTRSHVFEPIDIERLQSILRHFEGTHDFRAFAGAVEQNQKRNSKKMVTVRTVYSANLIDEGSGNYRIDFMLKGALYKMVRNMVGTALDICRGRLEERILLELLHRTDGGCSINEEGKTEDEEERKLQFRRKDNPCKPAPPEGLTLEHVFFDDGF